MAFSVVTANAATFGNFTYADNGTSITITDYPYNATGSVVIPNSIDGKPVTSIGDNAFQSCSGLTSVTIPSSVTSIEKSAFANCSGLTSITVSSSVTSIAEYAFFQCTGLTSVTIPSSVKSIGDWTFSHCSSLTSVTIPSSVTSIGDRAFQMCSGLTSITISSSVTSIAEYAFFQCTGLTNVTIPSSVTSIGYAAFSGCSGLTGVTILPGVTSIGGSAFSGTGITNVMIPSSVTSIGGYAFSGSSKLIKAWFQGNAPIMGSSVFASANPLFKVYFIGGKQGFTTPSWLGYPSVRTDGMPEISIQQPVGSELVDGSAKKSFGTMRVNNKSQPRSFTIQNIGTKTLTGLSVTINGLNAKDFIVTQPLKTSLGNGAKTTFKVSFKPTAKGTRNAVIHVRSNDANENPFDIKLVGLGMK